MELHLLFLIGALLVPAIIAVSAAELLHSAIALLIGSVGLTLLLFHLGAPLAGVFELSVCAGLISVMFILAISFTRPLTGEAQTARKKDHYQKFIGLPFLVLVIAMLLWFSRGQWSALFPIGKTQETTAVGQILWNTRGLDLIGQITILLVGVYGVVVLFRRGKMNE